MKTKEQLIQEIRDNLTLKFTGSFEDATKYIAEHPDEQHLIIHPPIKIY